MKDFEAEIKHLQDSISPLIAERDKLNRKIMSINDKIKKVRQEQETCQMASGMTKEEKIEYFLFEDGLVDGERYKARQKFWSSMRLHQSGYFPETEQIQLELMLYKGIGDNLEQTVTALEEVLPFIKPLKGVKRLKIFEHTLSEYGSYRVEISETSFDVVVWTYGRKSTVKSFDNLRSMVQYVQQHHYYESSVDEDDEE